jgi:hypothetical protein
VPNRTFGHSWQDFSCAPWNLPVRESFHHLLFTPNASLGASQEVLQLALESGIPSLIMSAVHGDVSRQEISFMANLHFGAGFVHAPIAIDHKNAAGRIGSASSLYAG